MLGAQGEKREVKEDNKGVFSSSSGAAAPYSLRQ